jgi:uncharacterized protein (DUF169 family)
LKQWQDLGKEFRRYTHVDTFPVSVAFLKSVDGIPQGTRTPVKDFDVKMAPCQLQAIVRRYGWRVAMTKEDMGCAIASHTYGWEPAEKRMALEFFKRMNYAADDDSALRKFEALRSLNGDAYAAVVYEPLERATMTPDVVLTFLNPAQLMRCLHGSIYRTGKPVESSFWGGAASCTEGVLGALLDQLPKVVVPGNGDRVWGTAQDHEMAYAFPASHLGDLVEGLAASHKGGIRYPIPTYLRYQPEVAFSLPLTDIFKEKG